MERTTWLDGLRGIAAAIVATDHYFMGGVLDVAFRSYWADPPEENRRLIQLPPIRILFAAHAMVPLFLVISGYAISVNLLRLRSSSSDFLRRLSSAVTRRILRIYLPVFCIATISQILYFCNIFHWNFGDEVVWGRKPWTAPWFHITYLFRYMMDMLNIITFQGNPGLNGQLWTMPFEFRGSCVIYITVLGFAFWRPQLRRIALASLVAYWFYFGLWDIFAFLAGLYLAESRILSEQENTDGEAKLPYYSIQTWTTGIRSINFNTIRTVVCLIFGIHLVCLSDDGFLPPGYQFLKLVESSRWDNDWATVSKCWKTAGSVLIVYAIGKSGYLQRLLNSRPMQYLGKISFSLYLVHQSIYHLVRDPIRDFLWFVVTREGYPGDTASERTFPFAFSWLVGYVILAVINIYVAHLYTRYIDERCVEVAKRFERWVTR
ncbi:acyltransferase 3 [Penicillium taxi]|uniref:acyltransferase 3 n=1 Tax=Penicillium taxi TaxID=168475 RepID=UPI002545A997|nr:acyltransferase 3 [Penicillium taxi]KAJ5888205.1 acyltransferase 3 [Penicillium taxi]